MVFGVFELLFGLATTVIGCIIFILSYKIIRRAYPSCKDART